jgi:pyridoxal phosphate enzyme (YggS family)
MADATQSLTVQSVKSKLQMNQNLLAISKLQPVEKIEKLYHQGQSAFGENYIQEALVKIESLKDLKIQWHLVGPIQKNKVKFLKNNFEYIHSVNSIELARLISEKAAEMNWTQKVFLQINISLESTKAGFTESELFSNWSELSNLTHFKIVGLMTMPPLQNSPEENRVYFKKCFELGRQLNLSEFSMGTSQDYQVALSEGATWIRLGTLLFGERLSA